jgi:hypothetical protein
MPMQGIWVTGDEFSILLKQHGGRSLSHRLFDEAPAIHLVATNRHEERAGTDPPAVELEIGEGKRRGIDAEGSSVDQVCGAAWEASENAGMRALVHAMENAPTAAGSMEKPDARQVRGAPLLASVRASLAGTSGGIASGRMLKSCNTPPMASAKGGVATAPP